SSINRSAGPVGRGEDVVPDFFRFWLSGTSCGALSSLVFFISFFNGRPGWQ
ncbi:hypothetical protein A2U01_0051113, partial [Trifolium medium]|nr:hypothetical protein [Trifolium medium]